MLVNYKSFPIGSSYSGKSIVSISKIDFLHSLIFVGQSRALTPLSALIYKYKILEPFLEFKSGNIIKIKTIDFLEQTEKTFLSYNIGMAISDFCLRNLFDCKYTLHTSFGFYKTRSFSKGKEYKFDLIGITKTGDKIALEAKGSLKGTQSKRKALNQVKFATINGASPLYNLASLQGFNKAKNLYVNIIDPFDLSESQTDIEISPKETITTIYQSIFNELKNGEIANIENHEFYVISFDGIKIGILKSLEKELSFDAIEEAIWNFEHKTNYKVFSSGLYIEFLD